MHRKVFTASSLLQHLVYIGHSKTTAGHGCRNVFTTCKKIESRPSDFIRA